MAFQALRSVNLRTASSLRAVAGAPSSSIRTFRYASAARSPYKDDQDRNTLKPRSTEGTKSGRDEDVAKDSEAFDPSRTRPETQRQGGGPELEVSGANQEVSKPQGDKPGDKGGAGKETRKGGKSGGGSTPKAGNV
ncbi:hypothetical protein CPLU01_05459 [Colletotrichum plurivorum]|uniref:Uncharacterized protein n=1 Tax=Colletotrichum plurivorum TaxID=2175906 RepID=A0A8H6NI03_9PEZI|nr:hypothetical protein CPLU01_05459 [Colletotrichum plurivorum]